MAKVADIEGLTPKSMDSVLEDSVENDKTPSEGVRLKKELSLLNGVAIIVGVIVGSGIFLSPNLALKNAGSKGMALIVWVLSGFLSMIGGLCYAELGERNPCNLFIIKFAAMLMRDSHMIVGSGIFLSPNLALKNAGSIGMALIVWVLSGFLSMIGGLCYAELGTMIPKSGGDYAYVGEAFGPVFAFLYLWVALFIIVPTGNAVTALTFAHNILKPLWITCDPPHEAMCLIAAAITCFLTVINCYNVKWVTRVQDSFTAAKILALLVIFFASLWYLFSGHTENLENMMQGTKLQPGDLAISFYSGMYSYAGWNYLNFVTEELKNPYKNLPRAIAISMPMVTLVYVLTNVAFFAVLTNEEILSSEAVAITFSDKILGGMSWIMSIFVALCTFGSLNGAIYTSSRLFFVGARNGHLPLAISLIDVKKLTPVPSLIFMCLVTLLLLMFNDVEKLIVLVTAVEATFTLLSVAGLLWMRRTHPKLQRPIRVSLILPIVYLFVCTFIIIFSCFKKPVILGFGIIFIVIGFPVYYLFIWREKPRWFQSACNSFNLMCSKMFMCLPEDSKEL